MCRKRVCLVYRRQQANLRPTFPPEVGKAERLLYLQDVISWLHVCDVDPLAVDVVSVRVPAADCDALRAKVGTFVPFLDA